MLTESGEVHSGTHRWAWHTSPRGPAGFVIHPALLVGEQIPRAQMGEQMDEPQLTPKMFDLRDGGSHRGLVGTPAGEHSDKPALRLEQCHALRAGLSEHRLHHRVQGGFLFGRQREAVAELQHMTRD
jgi:hypothetical protein